MSCKVRVTRHGYLAYRVLWKDFDFHEGTGLRDTPKNRERVQRRADAISDDIAAGTFEYLRWFPQGNQAERCRPAAPEADATPPTIGEWAQAVWLPRKVPPLVRQSLRDTYAKHLRSHILPAVGDRVFAAVGVGTLEALRADLIGKDGKRLSLKTARDVIDGTFRALYRDARREGLADGDPFAALTWPRRVLYDPDPFTADERDILLTHFRRKEPQAFPLLYVLFHTGLRTGEAVGLRWGAVDLRQGTLAVRCSRTRGEDNPPKTKGSQRTLTLLPEVVAVLRTVQPLHVTPDAFVFTTPTGLPLDVDRFVESRWHRALRATGVRPRKFYATRHTFISLALTAGCSAKWVARYCGTSLEMLDRHYARWMGDDAGQLALLDAGRPEPGPGGGEIARNRAATRNPTRNLRRTARKSSNRQAEGGDSNCGAARRRGARQRSVNPRSTTASSAFLARVGWPERTRKSPGKPALK